MEIVEKEDFARDQINQLQSAISDLDERSQLILKERWLTDDKPTLHELADKYGISAERIRQIEKKAMEKIRTNINWSYSWTIYKLASTPKQKKFQKT